MNKTFFPGSVWGQVDIPASKSQTIHTLLIALFARGVSTIQNPLICSDTEACLDFCRKLGAKITMQGDVMTVDSSDLKPHDGIEINCRNSGTTLYFATALASTLGSEIRFTGDRSLLNRPAKPLLASLHELGATVDPEAESAPYSVKGPLEGGHTSIRCMTGQYLNALLLATPLCAKDTTIDVHLLKERAATRMTEMWLERQNIEFFRDDEMYHYTIRGNQCYKPFFADINGDFSLAAFFFCAAAITASTVTVTHLDAKSSQADRAILDILAKMGCSIRSEGHFVSLTGPSRLKAIDIDVGDTPDLLPALAVTACFASGPVRFTNVIHNAMKGPQQRSSTIAYNINAIGGNAQVLQDSLVVYPISSFNGANEVQSFEDPRIAMAMAVAALRSTRGLTIQGFECVDSPFPDFQTKFSGVVLSRN